MKFSTPNIARLYKLPIRLTLVMGVFVAASIGGYLLLVTTTPKEVGPVGVTSLFILFFIVGMSTLTLVKMLVVRSTIVTVEGLVGLALVPTLLLALGSLRQLNLLDVVLVVVFSGLVNFYVKRATKKPKPN